MNSHQRIVENETPDIYVDFTKNRSSLMLASKFENDELDSDS